LDQRGAFRAIGALGGKRKEKTELFESITFQKRKKTPTNSNYKKASKPQE